MKIKNVSCTQFAGIRDHNVSFTDGINVLYGKNESGKSTTVNLLAQTLFQKAKLDGRRDKEFGELYFPGARKNGGYAGDFADGKVTFETEQGTYTLSKEWGSDARCMLATPNGVVRDQRTIDEILSDVLIYGKGVYTDFLLSSQRNTDAALQTLLDSAQKTDAKTEIVNAVSQAFAESDGIPVEAVEQAIQEKIDAIAGKHWDVEREMPARKIGRWSVGLGEILKAYYDLEDAKAVLDEISRLESDADRYANDYALRDTEACTAEEAYNHFNTYAGSLMLVNERRKAVERLRNELLRIQKVLDDWPDLEKQLDKAKALQAQKNARILLNQYEAAKKVASEMQLLSDEANAPCPTDYEIKQVQATQREISRLENRLCGMNLTAFVQMLGGNTVEITSVLSGRPVDISNGVASIKEAVKITVPGVMEMQLSPSDVDVSAIERELADKRNSIAEIHAKYAVSDSETLETLAKNVAAAKAKWEAANSRLTMLLGASTLEELETAALALPTDIPALSEIDIDITMLCGNADISRFITAKETVISGYASEYGSVGELKARAFDINTELEKAKNSLAEADTTPVEFASVSDPEAYMNMLRNSLEMKRSLREKALTAKTAAASKLESYLENIHGDPNADFEEAQRLLSEKKSLLNHWLHIQDVFLEQKKQLNANPMQDIADSFAHYLSVISDGQISSEFPRADKLAMQVYSGERLMDYGKLSEGTKETVSLAFRLAVLDHLFPDGGMIVLDDPFTDMDAERTAQGCELLKECAKRHQVIFLTCHEAYADMLQGNLLRI